MAEISEEDKELEDLLEEITRRFSLPKIDYFGRGSWRVWITDHHIHTGVGTHGSFTGYARTIALAAKNLLELADKYQVTATSNCTRSCPKYEIDIGD